MEPSKLLYMELETCEMTIGYLRMMLKRVETTLRMFDQQPVAKSIYGVLDDIVVNEHKDLMRRKENYLKRLASQEEEYSKKRQEYQSLYCVKNRR
jgi:type II secretory pathway predicted ATPase ExeA